jgi:hypothetical protein
MINVKRITAALTLLLIVTIASSLAVLQSQGQKPAGTNGAAPQSKDREIPGFRERFPVVDYDAEAQLLDQQRGERKNKNKRYDKLGLVKKSSSTGIEETVREVYGQDAVEAIPAGQSRAIIVGEVQASKAHLSNDKTGVYTEVLVRVDEVLKNDGSAGLLSGNTLATDRPGGIVKYPNGHERLYRILGLNMPRVRNRYVLFLTREDGEPNYRIITGYELGADGVVPLDVSPKFDAYKGWNEALFLKTVRDAIARS